MSEPLEYRSENAPYEELTHLADEIAALARSTPGISERLVGVDIIVHLSREGPGGKSGVGFRGGEGQGWPASWLGKSADWVLARKLSRTLGYMLAQSADARDGAAATVRAGKGKR